MKGYWLRFETFAVGVIGVFSGLFLFQTYQYGRRAALFPRIISGAVLFLTRFFIGSRIRRIKKQKGLPSEKKRHRMPVETEVAAAQGINWLLTLAAATGFFVLIYFIGFGGATFFYVTTHLYLSGYREHKVIFGFALAMAILMVGSGYLFSIPLPWGVLVERMLAAAR